MKTLTILCLIFFAQGACSQGVHSGISGRSVLFSCVGLPLGSICGTNVFPTRICIFNERGRLVHDLVTDHQGEFRVHLQPGSYRLVPIEAPPVGPGPILTSPIDVTVKRFEFSEVEIQYLGLYY